MQKERLGHLGLLILKRKMQRGDLVAVCSYLMGRSREDGETPFVEVHSERMRGKTHELWQGQILPNHRGGKKAL